MKRIPNITLPEAPRRAEMTHYLRLEEACEYTGLSPRTIYRYLKAGAFCASLPAGYRGGWRIVRPSFERWWNSRMGATSNRPAAAAKQKP